MIKILAHGNESIYANLPMRNSLLDKGLDLILKYGDGIAIETDYMELVNIFENIVMDEEDFYKLNALAFRIKRFDIYERNVFQALLYKNKPKTIEEVVFYAGNTNKCLIEDFSSYYELGKGLVKSEMVKVPTELKGVINYKKVGKEFFKNNDCYFTPYGFICEDDYDEDSSIIFAGKELINKYLHSIDNYYWEETKNWNL